MSPREAVLDWAATGVAVGGVFASLLTHDALQRIAIRFGPHAQQRAASSMARWINRAARLAGTRVRAQGLEHVDSRAHYVVVMNHQSLLDIAMTADLLAPLEPRYVSKIELARGIPGVSFNLRRGGSANIDRHDPAQAHAALAELGRRVRDDGFTVVLFPEGTRSKTGAMGPFKSGGLRTLLRSAGGVSVLPITSSGGSRLFRHGLRPIERNVELGFVVHPPVAAPDPDDEVAFDAFVRQLHATIESALPPEDLRGESGARPADRHP